METTIMDAMSIPELEAFRDAHQDNEPIVTICNNAIAVKVNEAEQVAIQDKFNKEVDKLTRNLPKPDSVHSVYLLWQEVEVEDTSQPKEEVELVETPAVLDSVGRIVTDAVMVKEMRHPKTMVKKWCSELNKQFIIKTTNRDGSVSTTKDGPSKRTILVYQHNPDGPDVALGEFASYQAFAASKAIETGGDSARRAIERYGYYGKPTS